MKFQKDFKAAEEKLVGELVKGPDCEHWTKLPMWNLGPDWQYKYIED